jgi:hypothetical protein
MTKVNLIIKYFIMKNLLNLGKVLNKAEQKEVFGGGFGDTGLPDVGPTGMCLDRGIGSAMCRCLASNNRWNSTDKCCVTPNPLPGFYEASDCV